MPMKKAFQISTPWHSRTADHLAVACAFDLLMVNDDDLRRQPLRERKLALGKLLLPWTASNTWNMPKVMATGCMRPSASSDWKGS
jgi:ATP-dependent DNA ligase